MYLKIKLFKYIINVLKKVKFIFTFFLLFGIIDSFAQCKDARGEYTIPLGDNSPNIMEKIAIQNAIFDALDKAFGTSYLQTISRQITQTTQGGKTTTDKIYKNRASSYTGGYFTMKGEPIITRDVYNNEYQINVTVNGKACRKENISTIEAKIMGENGSIESEYPQEGIYYIIGNDKLIVPFFISSIDGYLNVFYDGEDSEWIDILEPYSRLKLIDDKNLEIKKNTAYYVGNHDNFRYGTKLKPNNKQEIDKLIYVFSRNPFPPPIYNDDKEVIRIKRENFRESYDKWKQNENFQIEERFIQIRN